MNDIVLDREIRAWKGDINITKFAVDSVKEEMKEQLMGEMGKDMDAVLNGERVIEFGFFEGIKLKFRNWLTRIFKML